MAIQLSTNAVHNFTDAQALQSLDTSSDSGATAKIAETEAAEAVVLGDHVVPPPGEQAVKVSQEIRTDAHREARTFRGIGAARAQDTTMSADRTKVAPPQADTARVEAQVAQSEGGQKVAASANAAVSAQSDVAATGETGKAVEASGSQSDASAD